MKLITIATIPSLILSKEWAGKLHNSIHLSHNQQQEIVKLHNKWRSNAALGNLHQNKIATQMQEIKWDDELALSAKDYAQHCNYQHSDQVNFNTLSYDYGENLMRTSEMNITYAIERSSNGWAEEHQFYNHETLLCDKPPCGHYTQMVWETTTRIGCSISECTFNDKPDTPGLFVVCQYYPMGNYKSIKPYTYTEDNDMENLGIDCPNNFDASTGLCKPEESICLEESKRDIGSRCQHKSKCISNEIQPNTFECACTKKFDGNWCENSRCKEETLHNFGVSNWKSNFLQNDLGQARTFWDDESNNHPKKIRWFNLVSIGRGMCWFS